MNRLRILVLDDREGLIANSPGIERMRAVADVQVLAHSLDHMSTADLAEVQVLMTVRERTRLSAEALSRMPALELILQTGGHGYHVDADFASRNGIPVSLTRRAFGPRAAVPELTFALAIGALRRLPAAHKSMADGKWEPFLGRTLSGRTIGILGLGRHGVSVAKVAEAFGMRVCAWQRTSESSAPEGVELMSLEDLLAQSDVVSIHLKLTEQSRGLLDAEKLALMKPGAVLVNTSRGAIVDEAALVQKLRSGKLSAGLDVFAEEPLEASSPLRSLSNVVLTPHIGWTVQEVFLEFAEIVADQLEDYLNGRLKRSELLDPSVVLAETAHGGLSPAISE